jgi:hypothetical protein
LASLNADLDRVARSSDIGIPRNLTFAPFSGCPLIASTTVPEIEDLFFSWGGAPCGGASFCAAAEGASSTQSAMAVSNVFIAVSVSVSELGYLRHSP